MTEPDPTNPADPAIPTEHQATPSSDAASAPARTGFTLRGRKWVYGATLAAAGVLAGSGVTYAVVGTTPTAQSQTATQDGGGQRGGPMGGGGPGGQQGTLPDGQAPDGAPSSEPSASGGETT